MREKDLTNKYLEVGEMLKSRRNMLKTGFVVSAAALLGDALIIPASADKKGDVAIANVALNLEHQAIAAYKTGAGTGLLSGAKLDAAKLFLGQHEAHRDALIGVIKKFGGTPVDAKEAMMYEPIKMAVPKIKADTDILEFALTLEAQAASAYLGVLTQFSEKSLIPVLAGIAADEAQHAAILRFVLGKNPCPDPIVK